MYAYAGHSVSKRGKRHQQHVRVYGWEMQSPAWKSLSTDARALLLEIRGRYTGRANRIHLSVREMMARLNIGQRRAQRARDELVDRGFIRLLEQGTFARKARHASEYALLNEPLDGEPGPPPLDFMRWGRKKTTVAETATLGSRSDYRTAPERAKKNAHGSCSDYRQTRISADHGSCHGYTVSLPPPTPEPGWQYRGQIWRCRNGLVLDTQCATCRVWTTARGEEFDGKRHRCDPASQSAAIETLDATPGGAPRWLN